MARIDSPVPSSHREGQSAHPTDKLVTETCQVRTHSEPAVSAARLLSGTRRGAAQGRERERAAAMESVRRATGATALSRSAIPGPAALSRSAVPGSAALSRSALWAARRPGTVPRSRLRPAASATQETACGPQHSGGHRRGGCRWHRSQRPFFPQRRRIDHCGGQLFRHGLSVQSYCDASGRTCQNRLLLRPSRRKRQHLPSDLDEGHQPGPGCGPVQRPGQR